MRVLIENYRNRTAGHCGSGAMRNLIYHYCDLELPEAVVFGLGAGLDSVFFTLEGVKPPFMLFGRGASMEVDLAETLGVDYRESVQPDDDLAWQEVREEVIQGRPTMLSGDIFYLDYREYTVHFPGHRFVLLGFDEARKEVYVADRLDEKTETCSMEALRLSRNPPDGMSTYNSWGKFYSGSIKNTLPDACGIALHKTVERMLGLDTSQVDLMNAFNGGQQGMLAAGLAGLERFCEQLPLWRERSDVSDHLIYVDNAIVKFGTGGGFFRDHFAHYMHWAQEQRPDLVDPTSVDLAVQSARYWNELSPLLQALLKDSESAPLWQRVEQQVQ
ncbi:MAG: BtrH N-terminal domain-containing protein, partial [Pseudomonadota bacterium]